VGCDPGFTLSASNTCSANVCSCTDGSAATGTICTINGAIHCVGCDSGFGLTATNTCEAEDPVCTCPNGVSYSWTCTTNGGFDCGYCDDHGEGRTDYRLRLEDQECKPITYYDCDGTNDGQYWDGAYYVDNPCGDDYIFPMVDGSCFDTRTENIAFGASPNEYISMYGTQMIGIPCSFSLKSLADQRGIVCTHVTVAQNANLRGIPSTFLGQEDMNMLSVSFTGMVNIFRLPANVMHGQTNIKQIILSQIGMHNADFPDDFYDGQTAGSLEMIWLNWSRFDIVKTRWITKHKPYLKKFSLNSSGYQGLQVANAFPADMFQNMPELRELNLYWCHIKTLTPSTFLNTPKLTHVNLIANQDLIVMPGTFTHCVEMFDVAISATQTDCSPLLCSYQTDPYPRNTCSCQ
jgi:hypothetical protein